MSGELRAATIEFVEELCESVGPLVFAGYGGRIARLRHRVSSEWQDGVAGTFAVEARVEQVMQAWADKAPLPAIFPVLLELVSRPPGRVSVEDWRYEVTRLLAMCAGRDRAGYVAALGAYVGDRQMASVAEEVEDWLAEEA